MKKIPFIALLLLAFIVTGCYKTETEMANNNQEIVLSYPETNQFNLASSGLNFWEDALINPDLSLAADTLDFSIHLHNPADKPVHVKIGIDQSVNIPFQDPVADSVHYDLMPETYYNIPISEIEIPAGIVDTSFQVAIFPDQFDISETGYVLPVNISSTGTIPVSSMHTAFIHINKDPFPPYSRSAWTVVDFSSQEENGEGPDNGRVINLFDGNTATFWHSQWQGAQPGPPHWFIIDMHTEHPLHGIMFLPRQGVSSAGRPKNVKVEASTDNSSWTTVQEITLPDNSNWQKIEFAQPTTPYRYFKVTISSMYQDTYYTNMAELKVF